MSPNRSTGDVTLVHCLDASVQSSGCKIDLQTPAGPLSMTLPPGLKDGQTLRLAGRGELGADGKRGDVLLTVSFFSTEPAPAKSNEDEAADDDEVDADDATDEREAEEDEAIMVAVPVDEPAPTPTKPHSPAPAPAAAAVPAISKPVLPADSSAHGQSWQVRMVVQVGLLILASAAGVMLLKDAKSPPFPIYVTCAIGLAWVCQALFIGDAFHPARTPLRLGLLRGLRMILLTSVVIGIIGAHVRNDWPFEPKVETHSYTSHSYVNPMQRRSNAFGDLISTVFAAALFHLLLPFLPALIYQLATANKDGFSPRPLRLMGLTGELREPVDDPDFGRLEWDREKSCWRGKARIFSAGMVELFVPSNHYDPPSHAVREVFLGVMPGMHDTITKAITECYGRLREFRDENRKLDRVRQTLCVNAISLEPSGDDKIVVKVRVSSEAECAEWQATIVIEGDSVITEI